MQKTCEEYCIINRKDIAKLTSASEFTEVMNNCKYILSNDKQNIMFAFDYDDDYYLNGWFFQENLSYSQYFYMQRAPYELEEQGRLPRRTKLELECVNHFVIDDSWKEIDIKLFL